MRVILGCWRKPVEETSGGNQWIISAVLVVRDLKCGCWAALYPPASACRSVATLLLPGQRPYHRICCMCSVWSLWVFCKRSGTPIICEQAQVWGWINPRVEACVSFHPYVAAVDSVPAQKVKGTEAIAICALSPKRNSKAMQIKHEVRLALPTFMPPAGVTWLYALSWPTLLLLSLLTRRYSWPKVNTLMKR